MHFPGYCRSQILGAKGEFWCEFGSQEGKQKELAPGASRALSPPKAFQQWGTPSELDGPPWVQGAGRAGDKLGPKGLEAAEGQFPPTQALLPARRRHWRGWGTFLALLKGDKSQGWQEQGHGKSREACKTGSPMGHRNTLASH